MKAAFRKMAFAGIAAVWAVLWIPLTFLFVTVYVPAKAVPCMVRRGEKKRALVAALCATWPIWIAALAVD
ncbi:MAG: hypothetical protein EOP23_19515 [Hyphomicrobiales bacterium]|nr:MAG: hypothetical protein EOP23_19515 [Hyphomicrobiales bacterium]